MAITHNKIKKIVALGDLAKQLGLPGVVEHRRYSTEIVLVIPLGCNCAQAEANIRRLANNLENQHGDEGTDEL